MKTYPKSSAELNAQTMAFLASEVGDWSEKKKISETVTRDLGSIAAHDARPRYAEYVRKSRAGNYEDIDKRMALQNRYDSEFKPLVESLRQTLNASGDNQQHEAFIGGGGAAQVFSFERNSKEYVVRNMIHESADKVTIDQYTAGALQVQGLPHFEQIVAISYEDYVTVAERMPGVSGGTMSLESIDGVSSQQLRVFVDTLRVAHENDIYLDPYSPNNLMYDTTEGFGLIDLGSTRVKGTIVGNQTHGGKIAQGAMMLSEFGNDMRKYTSDDQDKPEYYAEQALYTTARLNLLNKYYTVVEQTDMEPKDREYALREIDEYIKSFEAYLEATADPDYVRNEIAKGSAWYSHETSSLEAMSGIDVSRF